MSTHLDELISRWREGQLSDEELHRLNDALATQEGRAALRGEWFLEAALPEALCTSPVLKLAQKLNPMATPQQTESKRWTDWLAWRPLAAAAALVILTAVGAWMMSRSSRGTERAFAVLAAANEAVWADPNVELSLRAGELPPGGLRLESGTAEFLCADGATVVMRGPAMVRFPQRKRVFVESGRIFCRCPSPESRLSVETATTEVVDLGTEFAVDARADRSTLVAVLSGEVQVGNTQPRLLRKGEAVVVRGDGILVIQPLAREEFSELLLASPSVSDAVLHGENVLRDPGFENGLREQTWSGTESNIEAVRSGGREGSAVRVFSGGYANWPQCRQKINTGDIAGKLVAASVWAATPARDPLHGRQVAMLKIVFVNDEGRDFAFAMRRFVNPKSEPDHFEQAQVAAFVPPGTRQVQIQLMLNSSLLDSGSVLFDDASLVIADAPSKN